MILSTSDDGRDASNETRYRRLQDFFLNAKLCFQSIGQFIISRMGNGARAEQLLILSNRFQGKEALQLYRKRWGIERLFWHLKQKGFDLESTHMSSAPKLDKLFAVLALSFLVSFAWGCQIRHLEHKPKQSDKNSDVSHLNCPKPWCGIMTY